MSKARRCVITRFFETVSKTIAKYYIPVPIGQSEILSTVIKKGDNDSLFLQQPLIL